MKNIWRTRYIAAALREDPANEDPASSFSTGSPHKLFTFNHIFMAVWHWCLDNTFLRKDLKGCISNMTTHRASAATASHLSENLKRNRPSLLPTLHVSSQLEALVYFGAKLVKDLGGLGGRTWVRGVVLLVALSWAGPALCLCVLSLTTFIKIKDSIASARWLSWGAHCCGRGARSCWILPYILHQTQCCPGV